MGHSRLTTVRLIRLPHGFRIMVPALVSQLVVSRRGRIARLRDLRVRAHREHGDPVLRRSAAINPALQMYVVVALVFIMMTTTFGKLAEVGAAGPCPRPPPRGGRRPPRQKWGAPADYAIQQGLPLNSGSSFPDHSASVSAGVSVAQAMPMGS